MSPQQVTIESSSLFYFMIVTTTQFKLDYNPQMILRMPLITEPRSSRIVTHVFKYLIVCFKILLLFLQKKKRIHGGYPHGHARFFKYIRSMQNIWQVVRGSFLRLSGIIQKDHY